MLNYSVASRKMSVGKDKGKTKYYAKVIPSGRLTLSMVEDEIVKKTSLAKGDVRNAIASLAEVVNTALLGGISVDLGDLGSFKVEANGRMMSTAEEVNANSVKKPQIRHYPRHEMRRFAQSVPINVQRKDGSVSSSVPSRGTHESPSGTEAGGRSGGEGHSL